MAVCTWRSAKSGAYMVMAGIVIGYLVTAVMYLEVGEIRMSNVARAIPDKVRRPWIWAITI